MELDRGRSTSQVGSNGRSHGKPEKKRVLVPGTNLSDQFRPIKISNDEFASTVLSSLPPGCFYRLASGEIATIRGEPGEKIIMPVDVPHVGNICSRHIEFYQRRHDQNGMLRESFKTCTTNLASHIKAAAELSDEIRPLERLTHSPVYLKGFKLLAPGWTDGTFYDPSPEIVNLQPEMNLDVISETLLDAVIDFPFRVDKVKDTKIMPSRDNFFGLLLSSILRPAIEGNIPMHIAIAPLERTGKSKLLEEVLGGIILGDTTPAIQYTGNDEELDKRLLAMLTSGETLIHLDNLSEYVNSSVLASLLTASKYMGRVLGKSQISRVTNTLIIAASGNNVRMTGELVKRSIPIQIQPATDHPESRTGFAHANLRQYIKSVRRRVLECLLGMVERWKRAGSPSGKVVLGGFEDWARVVGGILAVNGCFDWMQNVREWQQEAAPKDAEFVQFIELWAEKFGGRYIEAKDLLAIDCDYIQICRNKKRDDHAAAQGLGMRLKHCVGRPVKDWVIRSHKNSRNIWEYWLDGAESESPV